MGNENLNVFDGLSKQQIKSRNEYYEEFVRERINSRLDHSENLLSSAYNKLNFLCVDAYFCSALATYYAHRFSCGFNDSELENRLEDVGSLIEKERETIFPSDSV